MLSKKTTKKPEYVVRELAGKYYVSTLKDGVPTNVTKGMSLKDAHVALAQLREAEDSKA